MGEFSLKVYKQEMEAFFMIAFKSAIFAGKQVTGIVVVVVFLSGPEPERIRTKI